jgi:hypothetical protein
MSLDIVPVSLEQYDDTHYAINIGKNMHIDEYVEKYKNELSGIRLKIAILNDLRDKMATLKYKTWEHKWNIPEYNENKLEEYFKEYLKNCARREDLDDDYWKNYLIARHNEWPYFTEDDYKKREFIPKRYDRPDEVYSHLKIIKPNRNTACIFRNHQRDIDYYEDKNLKYVA